MPRPARIDPFAEVVIYRSPDWQPWGDEDAPVFRHEWDALLDQCRTAIARREAGYPVMIAQGQISDELASQDIAGWRLLAAEWKWIITGEGAPPPPASLPDRIAAVDLGLERIAQEIGRGRGGIEMLRQHQLLLALRWHLGTARGGIPAIHDTARLNHAFGRARAPIPQTDHEERSAA